MNRYEYAAKDKEIAKRRIEGMKHTSIVYWSRVGTAILVAVLCHFLSLDEVMGLLFSLAVFIGTSFIFERGLVLKTAKPKEGSSSRIWTIGIGTYYILWIMVWTLLNTILT
ncbi:Rab5-interacting family protein [Candidatus Bathyarchaeota archaeon]|nr:Rab5-interacting family protein [Candidatus Bathyarchaeota archaeon]